MPLREREGREIKGKEREMLEKEKELEEKLKEVNFYTIFNTYLELLLCFVG